MNQNRIRSFISLLVLIMGLGLLTACGGAEETTDKSAETAQENEQTESNESFPFTFEDATDTEITIEEKPQKIVSVIPSNTEIAFALGLDEEIIGVSDYDNYPKETEEKEKIGGLDFDVEKVLSLKPDLVLGESSMMGMSGERFEQLRDAGIKVAVVPASNSFADAFDTIELIGKLTGTADESDAIIQKMQEKINSVKEKINEIDKGEEPPNVLVEIDPELWTVGKGTFTHEMIEMLDAKNVADEKEGAFQLAEEEVVPLNPDVIIVTYGDFVDNPEENVYSRKGWEGIKAVKEKKVYSVDSDSVSRPGPRLADGLEEFAKAIYPDAFKE